MAEKDEYQRSAPEPFEVPAYWQEYLDKHAATDAKGKDDKKDDGGDPAPVKVLKRPDDQNAVTKKIEKEWGITLAPPPPPPPSPPKEEKSKGLGFSR